jgi:hypothetical protein
MLDTLSAGVDCVGGNDVAFADYAPDPSSISPDAVALALPSDMPYPHWIGLGRSLAARKRNTDWLIGDWIAFGREHYPEQVQTALFELADDPRRVKRIEATVAAFPPHMRADKLSFDHHAHVARMPQQEALFLLKRAGDEKLTARQLRIEVLLASPSFDDPDPDQDYLVDLARRWNNAPVHVRQAFAEMIRDSDLGVIDA